MFVATGGVSASGAGVVDLKGDVVPPTAPTGLKADSATQTSVTVSWQRSTDNYVVAGYEVFKDGSRVGSTSKRAYTLRYLACGKSYSVAVVAYDKARNRSSQTSVIVATQACPDSVPPSAPTNLSMTSRDGTSISISWSPSTDNVGVIGYDLYRDGLQVGSTGERAYTFGGLACDRSYTLGVRAKDGSGNRSTQTSALIATLACTDTQPPTAPQGLALTTSDIASVGLKWNASTDDRGVAGYRVLVNGTAVGTTSATSYLVTGLSCGKSYSLGVVAFDAAGNASSPSTVTGTTSACPPSPPPPPPGDTQAPTVPTGLKVTSAAAASITIAWTASTDNVGVAGYGTYRDGASIGTATATSTTFLGLTCGKTYTLAVDAFDAATNRSGKASISAATTPCPDTQAPTAPTGLVQSVTTETSVGISWQPSTDNVGVTGYGVYLNGVRVTATAGTTFTFSSLTCGTPYTVAVDAYDAAGNRSTTTSMIAPTSPCPPPSPTATLSVAPSGSDSNPCTAALPCKTLDRAYRAAAPGQVVEVAAGSYPDQTISSDASKTSASDVVFKPASGASVTVGSLQVSGAQHLTLQGLKTTIWRANYGDDITLKDMDTDVFSIGVARHVSVLGGDVGPWDSRGPEDSQVGASGSDSPSDIVFDGVYFHDYTNAADAAAHTECLQIMEGINVTIRNSRFQNCGVADVLYIRGDMGPIRNFLIENNFFGYTPTFSLRLSGQSGLAPTCENVLVRNNSALQRMWSDCTAIGSQGVRFVGNIQPTMDNYHCSTSTQVGTVWEYNVYESGIKCAATDRVGPVSYKNRGSLDLHLLAGSEAIGGGDPGTRLRSDIDGQARPFRVRADAGADQREPAALVLGRRIGMVEIGMSRNQIERLYGVHRVRLTRARPRRVGIASYARAGGRISVTYAADRVVGVATASAYYSTPSGLGVGAALKGRGRWSTCSRAYRRSLGPVTLDFRPAGGKGGKTIARIAMTRRAYTVC